MNMQAAALKLSAANKKADSGDSGEDSDIVTAANKAKAKAKRRAVWKKASLLIPTSSKKKSGEITSIIKAIQATQESEFAQGTKEDPTPSSEDLVIKLLRDVGINGYDPVITGRERGGKSVIIPSALLNHRWAAFECAISHDQLLSIVKPPTPPPPEPEPVVGPEPEPNPGEVEETILMNMEYEAPIVPPDEIEEEIDIHRNIVDKDGDIMSSFVNLAKAAHDIEENGKRYDTSKEKEERREIENAEAAFARVLHGDNDVVSTTPKKAYITLSVGAEAGTGAGTDIGINVADRPADLPQPPSPTYTNSHRSTPKKSPSYQQQQQVEQEQTQQSTTTRKQQSPPKPAPELNKTPSRRGQFALTRGASSRFGSDVMGSSSKHHHDDRPRAPEEDGEEAAPKSDEDDEMSGRQQREKAHSSMRVGRLEVGPDGFPTPIMARVPAPASALAQGVVPSPEPIPEAILRAQQQQLMRTGAVPAAAINTTGSLAHPPSSSSKQHQHQHQQLGGGGAAAATAAGSSRGSQRSSMSAADQMLPAEVADDNDDDEGEVAELAGNIGSQLSRSPSQRSQKSSSDQQQTLDRRSAESKQSARSDSSQKSSKSNKSNKSNNSKQHRNADKDMGDGDDHSQVHLHDDDYDLSDEEAQESEPAAGSAAASVAAHQSTMNNNASPLGNTGGSTRGILRSGPSSAGKSKSVSRKTSFRLDAQDEPVPAQQDEDLSLDALLDLPNSRGQQLEFLKHKHASSSDIPAAGDSLSSSSSSPSKRSNESPMRRSKSFGSASASTREELIAGVQEAVRESSTKHQMHSLQQQGSPSRSRNEAAATAAAVAEAEALDRAAIAQNRSIFKPTFAAPRPPPVVGSGGAAAEGEDPIAALLVKDAAGGRHFALSKDGVENAEEDEYSGDNGVNIGEANRRRSSLDNPVSNKGKNQKVNPLFEAYLDASPASKPRGGGAALMGNDNSDDDDDHEEGKRAKATGAKSGNRHAQQRHKQQSAAQQQQQQWYMAGAYQSHSEAMEAIDKIQRILAVRNPRDSDEEIAGKVRIQRDLSRMQWVVECRDQKQRNVVQEQSSPVLKAYEREKSKYRNIIGNVTNSNSSNAQRQTQQRQSQQQSKPQAAARRGKDNKYQRERDVALDNNLRLIQGRLPAGVLAGAISGSSHADEIAVAGGGPNRRRVGGVGASRFPPIPQQQQQKQPQQGKQRRRGGGY